MNELEQQWADDVQAAVNEWSDSTERTLQAKEFKLGPSDIGFCSERVRRSLDRQEETDDVDWNMAFIGTWLGDGIEAALKKKFPHIITQSELTVKMEVGDKIFSILGHADVIDPVNGLVLDIKAKNGLTYIRREETADQGYQFQRHLYALGAHQSGLFPNHALEDIQVGNIYYDRSGVDPTPHVQIEPFSQDVIWSASQWLEEVVYAFLHGEEARKEPARPVCEKFCGFYSVCRAYDTDVEGLITDDKQLTAIDMVLEARDLESQARKLKNEAQIMLQGVEGHTASHSLRWTQVNGGSVSYNRESYLKMELRKRPKPKK